MSVTSSGYIGYSRGGGENRAFGFAANPIAPTTYLPMTPANSGDSLVWDGGWTVTFKSGERRVFSGTTGNLVWIIDRNGNATSLTYNTHGQLATITDPASRTLTFSYTGVLGGWL